MTDPTNAVPTNAVPTSAALAAPVWHALVGADAHLADHAAGPDGRVVAARYRREVAPFAAVADPGDEVGWDALAALVGAGGIAVVVIPAASAPIEPWPPAGWDVGMDLPGLQMVADDRFEVAADPETVPLGPADVADMVALVERTKPGPFGARTIELGGYEGVREGGRLVAMAGQRMHPGDFTEISAVCTDADQRGKGLGARLVRSVAAGIVAARRRPFLHVASSNVAAIRLYEKLGLRESRAVRFVLLTRPPSSR